MDKELVKEVRCDICGNVIARVYKIHKPGRYEYVTENTTERYIDRWGGERDYCKKCMAGPSRTRYYK